MKRLLQCAREKCLCVQINGTIQANVSSWAPCGVKGCQVGMGLTWANVVGAMGVWTEWVLYVCVGSVGVGWSWYTKLDYPTWGSLEYKRGRLKFPVM